MFSTFWKRYLILEDISKQCPDLTKKMRKPLLSEEVSSHHFHKKPLSCTILRANLAITSIFWHPSVHD